MSTSVQESWVIATHNLKKLQELQLLLGERVRCISLADYNLKSPAETGLTFVENALIKARAAAKATGLPSLADDSGLVVPALQGTPGLYSARYAFEGATDADNNQALIKALQQAQLESTPAHYHCTLVLLKHAEDPDPLIAQGRWYGRVAARVQGTGGFGYDPMFYLGSDYRQTAAQLDAEVKAALSHRGIALRELQRMMHPLEARDQ